MAFELCDDDLGEAPYDSDSWVRETPNHHVERCPRGDGLMDVVPVVEGDEGA